MNTVQKEASNNDDILVKEEISTVVLLLESDEAMNDYSLDEARKKNLLYGKGADAVCEFGNAESIRVNKSLLSYHSPVFNDLFFGESPTSIVKIEDFDRDTFETFLNCLFGLKDCSVSDALMIYSIAHTYKVEKLLRKFVFVLKPTEMNENVCKSLNLALLYRHEQLINVIMYFIKWNVDSIAMLENKNFSGLLEPSSMSKLIEIFSYNSYIWRIIYEWGRDYLESRKINRTIRSFFDENDILGKLSLSNFESVQSILDFHELTNKQLLDSDEIFDFLRNNLLKSIHEKLPEKSCWEQVRKGESITETIVFKNSLIVTSRDAKDFTLNICRNVRRYNKSSMLIGMKDIKCKPRLHFRTVLSEETERKRDAPVAKKFRGNSSVGNLSVNEMSSAFDSVHDLEADYFCGQNDQVCFPIDISSALILEIKSVEITYTFLRDCRILKTSITENFVDADKLYFTKSLDYSQ